MNSPCIDVCTMDADTGLCAGCGRTLEEIAVWSTLSDAERTRIISELADRMRAAGLKVPAEREAS